MTDAHRTVTGAASQRTTNCITERRTPYGFWWRYTHAAGEPDETLVMAIRIASEVAADEARKSGKTYLVASTPRPTSAVYVFAGDHPDAARIDLNIMYELTPDGGCVRRSAIRH